MASSSASTSCPPAAAASFMASAASFMASTSTSTSCPPAPASSYIASSSASTSCPPAAAASSPMASSSASACPPAAASSSVASSSASTSCPPAAAASSSSMASFSASTSCPPAAASSSVASSPASTSCPPAAAASSSMASSSALSSCPPAAASSSIASSSASTSFPRPYDVFLNHRGPDVKNTFASHLYKYLTMCGLSVFLDREEMEKGENISSQIKDAITGAYVHIAIFYPRYAESYWCLEELIRMKDSGATIFPVFYKVEPSVVRYTTKEGRYAEALRVLQEKTKINPQTGEEKPRYALDEVQNWRNVLFEVSNLSGFEYREGDDEAQLCQNIVEDVLKKVPQTALHVADHEIGLDEILQDFEKTVLKQQKDEKPLEAKVVGIVGMGGIGKTTLAKKFIEIKKSEYNKYSFLCAVRETAERESLAYLQSKLLEDLTQKNIKIGNCDQGINILKKHLSHCQHVLVILDDVDDLNQLEAVMPIKNILSPDSLILVTSRHKDVLVRSGVLESSIYIMKRMNIEHSKELFCYHAFHNPHPLPGFADLVDRFVEECDGLPLSLKVFGAEVCKQEIIVWQEKLDNLHSIQPSRLHDRLKISYDSLEPKVQEIFLDIVCFFLEEKVFKAIEIWDNVGVRTVLAKCLLEVDSRDNIKMHDHIRDMGRKIAEEGSLPRRLWHTNIIDDLSQQLSPVVRGIKMVSFSHDPFQYNNMYGFPTSRGSLKRLEIEHLFTDFQLRGMRNLQLLATEEDILDDILSRVQPPDLKWLRWYRCSQSSLPDWIPMEKLRVLEVEGRNLNRLWSHQSQAVPHQLRELHICAPLLDIPKSIGRLKCLERIVISNYPNSVKIQGLPDEFCRLRSLKYLFLKDFSKIVSLPDRFGDLTNLEYVNLQGASSLEMLPNSFWKLKCLKYLYLEGASNLQKLPNSFGNLKSLVELTLNGCEKLQSIPGLAQLTNITTLRATGCHDVAELVVKEDLTSLELSCGQLESIQALGQGLGQYRKLRELSVSGCRCSEMRELRGVEHLTSLVSLYVSCRKLQSIPGLEQLTKLADLYVSGCGEIAVLPGVTSLENLKIRDCEKLQSIQALGQLTNLKNLFVSGCSEIEELSGVEHLSSLYYLRVGNCKKIGLVQLIKGLGHLTKLTRLILDEGNVLPGLQLISLETGHLTSLERLHVGGCQELHSIQGLGKLKKLEILSVNDCPQIQELLPGVEYLTECSEIQELLPGLEHWASLTSLDVRNCGKLQSIPGLGHLAELFNLNVSECSELRELPGVGHLTSLNRFSVVGCPKLQSIQGSGNLTNLKLLWIYGCSEIPELPGVEHLISLESLCVSCQKLQSIPELGQLTKLRSLYVHGCQEILELPDVSHLSSLEKLYVKDCKKLESIQGLGQLTQLRTLCIFGCSEIPKLSGVEHLTSLETLDVQGCKKLQSIQVGRSSKNLKNYMDQDYMRLYVINGWTHQDVLKSMCGENDDPKPQSSEGVREKLRQQLKNGLQKQSNRICGCQQFLPFLFGSV